MVRGRHIVYTLRFSGSATPEIHSFRTLVLPYVTLCEASTWEASSTVLGY